MNLLQTTQPNLTSTIESIAGLWKLALIVLVTILIIFFHKGIGRWFNRLIKFKVIGQEVHLTESTVVQKKLGTTVKDDIPLETKQENILEANQESSVDIVTKDTSTEEDQSQSEKHKITITEVQAKYIVDKAEAENVFKQLQQITDSADERKKNELWFLYIKFLNGDTRSLERLEQLLEEKGFGQDVYGLGHYIIGNSYENSHAYEKAIAHFEKSNQYYIDEEQISQNLIKIGECKYELKGLKAGIDYLTENISKIKKDSRKAEIYKTIASIYGKEKDAFKKALYLSKALTYTNNDTSIIFDLAYVLSELNFEKLSLFHYNNHTIYNNTGSVRNNLGVCLDKLKLRGLSKNNYRQAMSLGNTLSAGNLANKYVDAGFFDEAETVINEVKEQKNLEETVWQSLSRLKKEQQEENKKFKEFLEDGKKLNMFLNEFSSFYLDDANNSIKNISEYKYKMNGYDVSQTEENNELKFKWKEEVYEEKTLTIPLNIKAGRGTLTIKKTYSSDSKTKNLFYFFDKDYNIKVGILGHEDESMFLELASTKIEIS
jgi:hypothetical protein